MLIAQLLVRQHLANVMVLLFYIQNILSRFMEFSTIYNSRACVNFIAWASTFVPLPRSRSNETPGEKKTIQATYFAPQSTASERLMNASMRNFAHFHCDGDVEAITSDVLVPVWFYNYRQFFNQLFLCAADGKSEGHKKERSLLLLHENDNRGKLCIMRLARCQNDLMGNCKPFFF